MNGFLEMDIFFFATTIVVVAIGVLFVLILLRILRILGYLEGVSKDVSAESALLRADIAQLRENIRAHGAKAAYFKTFLTHALKRFTGVTRKRRAASENAE